MSAYPWGVSDSEKTAAMGVALTDAEAITLAKVDLATHKGAGTNAELLFGSNFYETSKYEAFISLGRFWFIAQTHETLYTATRLYAITKNGEDKLAEIRPYSRYRCCEFAIRIPCVCAQRTFCPQGHDGNGCHGTHD